jgi:two-component system phosphate regulon sensor histidine kinase PhoR
VRPLSPDSARHWLSSVRARVVLGYAVVIIVLAGAWAWSLYGPLVDTITEQQTEDLVAIANGGAIALSADSTPVDAVASNLVQGPDLRVTVIDEDGVVLADTQEDPSAMENHARRPEVAAALSGEVGSDSRVSDTQEVEQLYVAVPGSLDDRTVAFRVSRPLDSIQDLAAQARRTSLIFLAVGILASLLVAYRVSAASAEPIRRLANTARAMGRGDLAVPVPQVSGELAVLADALAHLSTEVRTRMSELEGERTALRTVLNGLTDAVFLIEGGRIRLANEAASEFFRSPAGGWRGASLDATVIPASLAEQVASHARSGAPESWEWGPDPRQRYLRMTVLPLSLEDESDRTLVVASDITERRRLDSVRRDFVSNASHELKTPTSGIQLLAESAAAAAEDGDTEAALAFVSRIQGEAGRLRQLVQDLLDLSRLETTLDDDAVTDLRKAVSLSVTGHRGSAEKRGLDLTADLSAVEGQDVFVVADATDVAVALDNLLDNAVAYTEVGEVVVRVRADEEWATIEVSDTGIGIPEEVQDRVFERFFRVDPARTRATGGTGLGLSLVRHAVQRSGGALSLDSTPGAGTKVSLTLRRAS